MSRLPLTCLALACAALLLRLTGLTGEVVWLVDPFILISLLLFIVTATVNALKSRPQA